ncbi:hypothetical protein [Micromonospora sp. NPDC048839]|uniref:hypothetical protein n=1 Tax=Micromonospora sp. NPDC048839 TaxID=3155641 RepID=UPI0033F8BA19
MIALLLTAISVLLLLCTALTWVLVICDRTLKSRAVRLHHQADRIRHYREELADKTAENKLLAEALDEVIAANRQLTENAAAGLTPATDKPWPRWGYRTLRDICNAASPADFDRKDNR